MADNENNNPTYLEVILPLFLGTKLRNAQYLAFLEAILEFIDTNAATLLGEEIVPVIDSLKKTIEILNRAPISYTETALIEGKDALRDKLVRVILIIFKRALKVPQDSETWNHANELRAILTRFLDLAKLSMTEQNYLVKNICEELSSETNTPHVEALGLTPFLTSLGTTNNAIRVLYRARMQETGRRKATRGGKSVRELRIEAGPLLKKLIDRFNVVYEMQPSEITQNIMVGLLGVFDKFQAIAAANGSSVPDDGEEEQPDPTPTPDDGEDDGEDEGGEGGGETEQPVTE